MPKIEMKINRYVKHIGKEDVILDNGAIIQVITQKGVFVQWDYAPLIMSKKLFNELKKLNFIYPDEQRNTLRKSDHLNYYRFNIDRLIASGGYKVIEEEKG